MNIICPFCNEEFDLMLGSLPTDCPYCRRTIPKKPNIVFRALNKCFSFVPERHRDGVIIVSIAILITIVALIPTIRKNCRAGSISDQVFAMLKGEKYCARCRSNHEIGVVAEQVWTKGTLDEGWVSYVSLVPKDNCKNSLIYEYTPSLRKGRVYKIKFEKCERPSHYEGASSYTSSEDGDFDPR